MREGADEQRGAVAALRAPQYPAPVVVLTVWNVVVFAAWGVAPFVAAGSWTWWPGWAHLGAQLVLQLGRSVWVRRKNPALSRARQRIGEGTPAWDVAWNALFWPLMASVAIVAGFDARTGSTLPPWTWPVGFALLAGAVALSARAMGENPHFEGTVRVQTEREHRVIDTGPYAVVRHPGYVGLAVWALATPLLLLSAWAFVPAGVTAAWVVVRTALEDAFLRRNLRGYDAYAARVRARLVPGVW